VESPLAADRLQVLGLTGAARLSDESPNTAFMASNSNGRSPRSSLRAKRSTGLGDIRIVGAVGAALFPYHLDRSKLSASDVLDAARWPVRLNSRGFRLRLRRWSWAGDIERRPDCCLASQFGVRGGLASTNHKCLLKSLPDVGNKLLIV